MVKRTVKKAKHIIISHAYSNDNKGDAALLAMLVQEVRRVFGPCQITILTMDQVKKSEKFEGAELKPSFMHYTNYRFSNKMLKLVYSLYVALSTIIWAYFFKLLKLNLPLPNNIKSIAYCYEDADLIIGVGGGYLRGNRSITSLHNLTMLLHPIVLSSILGKPTVLFTQSIGPFYRKNEIAMLKHVLNKDVALTILREDKSMKLLKTNKVNNIVRSVDTGFLLKAKDNINIRSRFKIPKDRLIIGVTARKWLEGEAQAKYEQSLAEALDYLIEQHNAHIIFIPQVTSTFHNDDDRLTSIAIYKQMKLKGNVSVVKDNLDYYQIKALYDGLDFIIGTRFHSVIFSLTSMVPALAIEYEYKTSGIMHDLDLHQWVIRIEEVNPKLLKQKMNLLIKESGAYRVHLGEVLPAYTARAHEAIELTKQAYEDSVSS